jgi:tetratricopeptide (TPR) repeat protein
MKKVKEVYEALEVCTDDGKRLDLLFSLATHLLNFDDKRSLEVAEQISELSERIDNNLGRSYYHSAKARVLYKRSEFHEATDEFQKALDAAMLSSNHTHQAICLDSLGIAFRFQKRYEESEACSLKALEILNSFEMAIGYTAICYNNLGSLYQDQEEYDKATACFAKGLEIAKQHSDERMVANLLNNLCAVAIMTHQYNDGLKYTAPALAIFKSLNHKHGEVHATVLIGLCYLGLGNHATAMDYFLSGLKQLKNVDHKLIEVQAYKGLGEVYAALLAYPEANKNYSKAIAIGIKAHDYSEVCTIMLLQAKMQLAANDLKAAKTTLTKARTIATEQNLPKQLAPLNELATTIGLP